MKKLVYLVTAVVMIGNLSGCCLVSGVVAYKDSVQSTEYQSGLFVNETPYDLVVRVITACEMCRGKQDFSFNVRAHKSYQFSLLPGTYHFIVTRAGQTVTYNWDVDTQKGDNVYDGKVYDFLIVQHPAR